MKNRLIAVAIAAVACLSSTARAQSQAADSAVVVDTAATLSAPHVSVIDRPSDAVRRPALTPAAPAPSSTGAHLGEAKAEMAVGVAAIVAGAVVGGDGGHIISLGGAVIGLYGLWNYLR